MLEQFVKPTQVNAFDASNIKNELLSKTHLSPDVCSIVCKYYETQSIELNVPSKYLSLIINYMEHQNGIPGTISKKPITSKYMKDMIKDKWIVDFVEELTPDLHENEFKIPKYKSYSDEEKKKIPESRKFMFQLMEMCNYLQIECLLYILCAKTATMIKGKSAIEMQKVIDGIVD